MLENSASFIEFLSILPIFSWEFIVNSKYSNTHLCKMEDVIYDDLDNFTEEATKAEVRYILQKYYEHKLI